MSRRTSRALLHPTNMNITGYGIIINVTELNNCNCMCENVMTVDPGGQEDLHKSTDLEGAGAESLVSSITQVV